jgi:hypothetical protein
MKYNEFVGLILGLLGALGTFGFIASVIFFAEGGKYTIRKWRMTTGRRIHAATLLRLKRMISWKEDLYLQIFTVLCLRFGNDVLNPKSIWFDGILSEPKPDNVDLLMIQKAWDENNLQVQSLRGILKIKGSRKNPVLVPTMGYSVRVDEYNVHSHIVRGNQYQTMIGVFREYGLDVTMQGIDEGVTDTTMKKILLFREMAEVKEDLSASIDASVMQATQAEVAHSVRHV